MSRRVALFLSRRAPIWHCNRAQILRRRLSNVDVTSIDIGQLRSSVLNRIDSRKDEIIRKSQTNLFDTILDNVLAGNATDDDVKKTMEEMDSQNVVELATDIYSSQERAGSDVVHLAAPLFRSAAMQGNINAKYTYAQLLRQGQGVTPDPSEAATLFSELSRGGHPYAQFALAGMYSAGLGVEKNAEKSLQLYRLSAKNGIVQAHNAIGNLYLNEIIEGKGPLDAIECFQKGIEMGDMHAHMSMAHCYNHGKGVTKDESKAFHHLQIASQSV
ncbi:sel1-repeat-containing protein YbeQ-like isoform X2 [Oscarella lobularis]|uniref:sel1-repeat-containing protein YbeQ-like isoform X2 n=1 Tax=Oscarella lobularis TaxID=121494 RepID=UPI0033144D89